MDWSLFSIVILPVFGPVIIVLIRVWEDYRR